MSSKKKVDRRIRRTRGLLQKSLLELLQKKRLAKIQIKEITEHADLSRQAFYLHFESKEDLLFSYLDDVFTQIHKAIFEDAVKANHLELRTLTVMSFQLWAEHASTLQWVMQVKDKDMLIARLRRHVAALMAAYAQHPETKIRAHPMHEHIVDFLTGGVYMLFRHWMEDGMTSSAEEMGWLAYQLIKSAVRLEIRP